MKAQLHICLAGFTLSVLSACATSSVESQADDTAYVQNSSAEKMESSSGDFSIRRLTCWDVLTAPEEDMNMAMMLVYGYSEGEHKRYPQTPKSIESAFKTAFDFCETSPDSPVYRAFQIEK